MLFWGPGYQWPPLRSCRFPLRQSPSSLLPQCTDGQCKAPWSARACGRKQHACYFFRWSERSYSDSTTNVHKLESYFIFRQLRLKKQPIRASSRRTCLLCHHIDFDSKHPTLLFRRRSLQAEVPTCEFHGELHFDLMMNKHSLSKLHSLNEPELNSVSLMNHFLIFLSV